MKRECPNEKRVLLTRDGYASASDEEAVSDTSSENLRMLKMWLRVLKLLNHIHH